LKIGITCYPTYGGSGVVATELGMELAARGHEVHLLTSPFLLDDAPEPDGYVREELFIPLSGRVLRGAPRARFRLLLKGAEYVPSVLRLLRRVEALEPDVVHVQWLPRPEHDIRWLRRLARRLNTRSTMPDWGGNDRIAYSIRSRSSIIGPLRSLRGAPRGRGSLAFARSTLARPGSAPRPRTGSRTARSR